MGDGIPKGLELEIWGIPLGLEFRGWDSLGIGIQKIEFLQDGSWEI